MILHVSTPNAQSLHPFSIAKFAETQSILATSDQCVDELSQRRCIQIVSVRGTTHCKVGNGSSSPPSPATRRLERNPSVILQRNEPLDRGRTSLRQVSGPGHFESQEIWKSVTPPSVAAQDRHSLPRARDARRPRTSLVLWFQPRSPD